MNFKLRHLKVETDCPCSAGSRPAVVPTEERKSLRSPPAERSLLVQVMLLLKAILWYNHSDAIVLRGLTVVINVLSVGSRDHPDHMHLGTDWI